MVQTSTESGGRSTARDAACPDLSVIALAARAVTKRFPNVVANEAVTLEVQRGEIHALLGENGSGKSTLCKMLTGLYRPDEGWIEVDGRVAHLTSPKDAYVEGIFMVHQHFSLVDRLTVAENVVLGWSAGGAGRYRASQVENEIAEVSERFGIHVDPAAHIWQLSVGERQRVEILKALYRGARTLIMDEPTTVLTPQECDSLFNSLRRMADGGASIIFISHKLPEVSAVCDRATVLRKGQVVGTGNLRDGTADIAHLACLMVGREVTLTRRARSPKQASGEPLLQVEHVSSRNHLGQLALDDVSLEVRPGEIVGVAGVAGNGQRDLAEVITGLRNRTAGTVRVAGVALPVGRPRAAIQAGAGYVPQDRMGVGLAPGLSVEDNVMLKAYRSTELTSGPFIRARSLRERTQCLLEQFDVRGNAEGRAGLLSGGNAQKIVLARELSSDPKILIAESPTRGLDLGAIDGVRRLLIKEAEKGLGILLMSEDLDELLDLSDRILVMYRGRIVGEVLGGQADRSEVGLMMAGIST